MEIFEGFEVKAEEYKRESILFQMSFMIKSSMDEVISALCLYICMCVVLSLIYILTESDKLPIDFTLYLNDIGNLTMRLNNTVNDAF